MQTITTVGVEIRQVGLSGSWLDAEGDIVIVGRSSDASTGLRFPEAAAAHVQRFVSRRPARWPEPGASSECVSNLRTAII